MTEQRPLVWKDPPPSAGGYREEHEALAQQLREHPGQWALIRTCKSPSVASNYAQSRNRGVIRAFRPVGDYETVTRGCDVYARYVGAIDSDEEHEL